MGEVQEQPSDDVKGKGHTPKANHPWKQFVKTNIARWACEESKVRDVNTWKVGGGRGQR